MEEQEPKRKGKPKLATPKEMKSIWDPTKKDPNLIPPAKRHSKNYKK